MLDISREFVEHKAKVYDDNSRRSARGRAAEQVEKLVREA